MSKTFARVRKGYDPVQVDSFLREQADAWRSELSRAQESVGDWRRRAGELAATVSSMERRLADAERDRSEQVAALETTVAELRWSRDKAQSDLLTERENRAAAEGEAGGIVRAAELEVARMVAAAEADIEAMYESARRRISMAEEHARERLQRGLRDAPVEISVRQ
jgi:DivIVA domain-containing protein